MAMDTIAEAEFEPPEEAELSELAEELRTRCAAVRQAAPDLAGEVVRAARHALALHDGENIAAFSLACALEWLGEHAAAADAYREAVRLNPQGSRPHTKAPAGPDITSSTAGA